MKFINPKKINSLLGYSILNVISGSMSPEINEGDIIIIKKYKNYEVGDIITFSSNDEIITHRIYSIIDDYYFTKGDANNTIDLEPIEFNQIYGKVIFHFNSFIQNLQHSSSKYTDLQTFHVYGEIENSTE